MSSQASNPPQEPQDDRAFFLLRGAPASGKTTWCETNNLQEHCVRSDAWKIKISGYTKDEEGHTVVSHENLPYIWDCINNDIFDRMKRQDPIVILDSNNRREEEMRRYPDKAAGYGYRCYLIDFYHQATLEECLERNLKRDPLRYCPEWAIHRFYDEVDENPVPDEYDVVTPDDALLIIKGILGKFQ